MSECIAQTLDLVRASQGGDDDALNQLFARYYARVLKVVRLRMGPKLRERLESGDVLQEVFRSAFEGFDQFEMRDEASFINWLSKIAQRRILTAWEHFGAKKRSAGREVPIEFPDASRGHVADIAVDTVFPLERLVRHQEMEVIDQAIAELPDQYRELVVLRHYVGLSFREIAEETGRPSEGAARMMHAKAVAELERRVKAALGER